MKFTEQHASIMTEAGAKPTVVSFRDVGFALKAVLSDGSEYEQPSSYSWQGHNIAMTGEQVTRHEFVRELARRIAKDKKLGVDDVTKMLAAAWKDYRKPGNWWRGSK